MKKVLLLTILFLLCHRCITYAQLYAKGKTSAHFMLHEAHLTLSNNCLVDNFHNYTPVNIDRPVELYYTAYGRQVTLSAFKEDSLTLSLYFEGQIYFDKSLSEAGTQLWETLQARVMKNGTVCKDWQYVYQMAAFEDTGVVSRKDSTLHPDSYQVLNDSLELEDSLQIEIRHTGQPAFLKIHISRKDAYTQPFVIAQKIDTTLGEAAFIQSLLLHHAQLYNSNGQPFDGLYFDDWPPSLSMTIQHAKMPAHARLLFYLRKEYRNGTDSVYQYRVLGGQYSDTSWQLTNGLIPVSSLQDNSEYTVEIRYADGHGAITTLSFYTPPRWYQTSWFRIAVALLSIVLLLLLYFIVQTRRIRRKHAQQRLEMQALYAQMNPHFLFNAMGSIQGLVNDGQIEQANKYLTGFATLLRHSITFGAREYIPLSTELKSLNNYIELERLRFHFQYVLQVADDIPQAAIEVPPLLAQPLIENAVKHGLSAQREKGELILSLVREEQDVLLSVTDNGPGFDTTQQTAGHGIRLTRERIALFNRMHKGHTITLELNSYSNGTSCTIRFKNWLAHD